MATRKITDNSSIAPSTARSRLPEVMDKTQEGSQKSISPARYDLYHHKGGSVIDKSGKKVRKLPDKQIKHRKTGKLLKQVDLTGFDLSWFLKK